MNPDVPLTIRQPWIFCEAMTLTDQLRHAALASGLPQAELARRLGCSRAMVSRFVRGERELSMPAADALAALLGLRLTTRPGQARKGK